MKCITCFPSQTRNIFHVLMFYCVLECEWPWPSNILLYSITNTRAHTSHICNVPNAFIHFKEHSQFFVLFVRLFAHSFNSSIRFRCFSCHSQHSKAMPLYEKARSLVGSHEKQNTEKRMQSMICFRYDLQSVSSIFAHWFWCAATINDCCSCFYVRLYFANNMRCIYVHCTP